MIKRNKEASVLVESSLLVVCVVKNEILRLPYFLDYYRSMGVKEFAFVDNGSTDGTFEYISKQADCSVFQTFEPYSASYFGTKWVNEVCDDEARGKWVLWVDADEFLIYPFAAPVPLFLEALDAKGIDTVFAVMIDMYSNAADAGALDGDFTLERNSWFDGNQTITFPTGPTELPPKITGGVRERMLSLGTGHLPKVFRSGLKKLYTKLDLRRYPSFDFVADVAFSDPPALFKYPLLKWNHGVSFTRGAHKVSGAHLQYEISVALLHLKFVPSFLAKVEEELLNRQHFAGGVEYRSYARAFTDVGNLAKDELSIKFQGVSQLQGMGLVRRGSLELSDLEQNGNKASVADLA